MAVEPGCVYAHTLGTEPEHATYRSLLHLDALLELQPPVTCDGRATTAGLEKHFFVLIHQVFELWFKQIIQDIDAAIADLTLGGSGWGNAAERLQRVVAVEELLVQQMRLLSHLDRAAFVAFRDELGTASGAESSQFYEIQDRLGLLHDDEPGPLWVALHDCLEAGTSRREDGVEMRSEATAILEEVIDAWYRLWATHASIVRHLIGDRPGTGGTSGVDYLKRSLARLRARSRRVMEYNADPHHAGHTMRALGDES